MPGQSQTSAEGAHTASQGVAHRSVDHAPAGPGCNHGTSRHRKRSPPLCGEHTTQRSSRGRAYLNRTTQLHMGVGTSKHFIERWSAVEAWGHTFDIVPRSRPSKFLSVRPGGSTNLQRHRNMASVSGVATACHDAYSATNRESRHWRFPETSHEPSLIHCGRKSAHWHEGLCKAPPAARPHS